MAGAEESQGPGWWLASDGRWYPPEQQPAATPPVPLAMPPSGITSPPGATDDLALPAGVVVANPWTRLGAYLLESLLFVVTLGIGWLIWAATIGGIGQTPAKKLLGLRVIKADSMQPAGLGWMFWMRGVVAGFVVQFAILFTLGIILFMPFWDKRKQNLWDKISTTYVVSDANDAWNTRPTLT